MEGTFKVISSNLRFDNPADGIQCWEMRRKVLATAINSHTPLLIGTQEGRKSQLHDFSELLPNHEICSQHRDWIEERMYPTMFLNPGSTHIIESGDRWLSNTPDVPGSRLPDSAFPRLLTWIRFQFADKHIIAVNMHIDHLSDSTRLAQVKIAIKELEKIKNTDDFIIIMGDFNDSPRSLVRSEIIQSLGGVYDPWLELKKEEEVSHHSFSSSYSNGLRIDWILLDKRIQCVDIFLDKTREGKIWPSDHFPLVCEIKF